MIRVPQYPRDVNQQSNHQRSESNQSIPKNTLLSSFLNTVDWIIERGERVPSALLNQSTYPTNTILITLDTFGNNRGMWSNFKFKLVIITETSTLENVLMVGMDETIIIEYSGESDGWYVECIQNGRNSPLSHPFWKKQAVDSSETDSLNQTKAKSKRSNYRFEVCAPI